MFKQIEEVKSTKRIKEDEKIKKKQRDKYIFVWNKIKMRAKTKRKKKIAVTRETKHNKTKQSKKQQP